MARRSVALISNVRVNTVVRDLGELGARHRHLEVNIVVVPDDDAFVLRYGRIRSARKTAGVRTDGIALDNDGAGQAMTCRGVRKVGGLEVHRVFAHRAARRVPEVKDEAVAEGEVVDPVAEDAVIASVVDREEVKLNVRNAR